MQQPSKNVRLVLALSLTLASCERGPSGNDSRPKPTASASAAPVLRASREVPSVTTPAGRLAVGDMWEHAQPKVESGEQVVIVREGDNNRFVETRKFKGQTFELTFERPAVPAGGSYRLVKLSAFEPEPVSPRIDPVPFSAMTADEVLAQQKAEAQSTADRARRFVETNAPDLASSLYRRRRMVIDAVRRDIASDPSFTHSDKARIDEGLKAERDSIERILAAFSGK